MNKLNIVLVKPSNPVLNLRAAAKKTGFLTGSSMAEKLNMQERKVRRLLSGHVDIKADHLYRFGELFEIDPSWFLKDHNTFLLLLNDEIEGEHIKPELEPIYETEEIHKFDMIMFGCKSGQMVLNGAQGFFIENIKFAGTTDKAFQFFEELCLRSSEDLKIEAGVLKMGLGILQEYVKEKRDVLVALENKIIEIWTQVNPDIAELWKEDEFSIYDDKSDRFIRILPNKEYELVHSLKNEIFPHKINRSQHEE